MHARQARGARVSGLPATAATRGGVLQSRADRSGVVTRLGLLQRMADAGAAAVSQLYATEVVKGQDGHFVPSMTSAIHCHVGRKMRQPHLKIGRDQYNFGSDYDPGRVQTAYDALVDDPHNKTLPGYADCVEYLSELLGISYQPEAADTDSTDAPAPTKGKESKSKKKPRKKR